MLPAQLPTLDAIESAFGGQYSSWSLLPTQGGQGVACKTISTDGVVVAMKIYKAGHVEERSEREVTALRQLTGEHLVRLHDAGRIEIEGETFRFIATTFVEGRPVDTLVAGGPLGIRAAARIVADIADAIEELWNCPQKIVHRDIKPDNIIVQPSGRAVLIDLGIARHVSQRAITTAGHTYGTPGYCAPEHLMGRPLSCKADIFAAGIVFQEMLVGRHPTYRDQNLLIYGGPKTASVRGDVPRFLAQLIDRMVARHAYDRPRPEQVKTVIESYLTKGDGAKS